ncbi:MAG TPA: HDOD domain-containing protein [Bryobacteraceae bacterium]|jgi:putative nucleotidyltransferase with HDIG domain|nr:HDOD domain-containing protein [Bryobacteraceae bacterium]
MKASMIDIAEERSTPKQSANKAPWALERLPPFPVVATRLLHTLSKEDVEISDVGKMIAADPVFATRLLQMANSPLFALQQQVKTIAHAIMVLGLERVRAITLTRSLGDFVAPVLKVEALRACWQNSLAGAILSEKLAPACGVDPDFAYVAGLLRDIGRLALLVKYPQPYGNVLAVSGENAYDLMATERELFDIDHCEAGAWLMRTLPFPPELTEVVAHHHDAPDGAPFRMVHLVHVADLLAEALGLAALAPINPQSFEEVLEILPQAARSRFHPNPEELKAEIDAKIQFWN